MINKYQLILLVLGMLFLDTSYAEDGNFKMHDNATISVAGQQFSDMQSYLSSDYFRASGRRCGTDLRRSARIGIDELNGVDNFRSPSDCTASLTKIVSEYSPTNITYTIPVWFHVIYNSSGTGNISDAVITAQMQVLNEDYAAKGGTLGAQGVNTRIQFELVGTTRTENDSWFDDGAGFQAGLGRDPTQFLNIYTNSASGFLGYATLPQGSAGSANDGVVMNHFFVGGRDNGADQYDQGRTLVHEAGHYLGLEHTFEGGCQNSLSTGDLISDTNAEASPHFGCAARSTCDSPDPIENYMDYSDDICMTQFTAQQSNRQVCSLVNYRANLVTATIIGSNTKVVIAPLIQLLLDD
jgi:hypothetical protein